MLLIDHKILVSKFHYFLDELLLIEIYLIQSINQMFELNNQLFVQLLLSIEIEMLFELMEYDFDRYIVM